MKFPSKQWVIDAITSVVIYGLLATAAAFTAAPSLELDALKAIGMAGVTAAFVAAKAVVAGLINGTTNLIEAKTSRR